MTALILEEAKTEAKTLIAEAEIEAEALFSECQRQAREKEMIELSKSEQEASERLARAKSSVQRIRQNALLRAKSGLVDDVFALALEKLVNLPDGERLVLYGRMFDHVWKEQLSAEQTAAAYDGYGEYKAPTSYTAHLSGSDLATIGKQFFQMVSAKLQSVGKSLIASNQSVPIAGGFILICGDVELYCSFSRYMEQIRSQTEGDVCQILFS